MSIRVAHDPGIGSWGPMAFAAGEAKQRERTRDWMTRLNMFQMQMQHQAQQAEMNRRAHIASQAMAQGGDLARMVEQNELLKDRVRFEFTERQKREFDKIANDMAYVNQQVTSGRWTPEQAEYAKRQLESKMMGIQPQPAIDDQPKPSDIFQRNIVQDPLSKKRFLLNGNKFEPLDSKTPITLKDFSNLYANVSTSLSKTTEDGTIIPADPAQVAAEVSKIVTAYKMMVSQFDITEDKAMQNRQAMQELMEKMKQGGAIPAEGMGIGQPSPERSINPLSDERAPGYVKRMALLKSPEEATPDLILDTYTKYAKEKLGQQATWKEVAKEAVRLAREDGWKI